MEVKLEPNVNGTTAEIDWEPWHVSVIEETIKTQQEDFLQKGTFYLN